jgi:Mg-chelatase subunit ChlD
MDNEAKGPAERIVQTVINNNELHMWHNRPGYVVPDNSEIGVKWAPVTTKEEDGKKIVYAVSKRGRRKTRTKLGQLWADNTIRDEARRKIGEYRPAGMFPEVATWMYRQVAEVWRLDNEFAARWASFAFPQEHKDLKVVLAAFMLVQSRKGDPVRENGEVLFHDDDFRGVGEAMCFIHRRDKKHIDPKMLARIRDVLEVPAIAELNRELGFGRSPRKSFLGRWPKAVRMWLKFREENPTVLEGLVNSGQRKVTKKLAKAVGYKPQSSKFFEVLGWSQAQAKDGHRQIAIGQDLSGTDTWEGLTEQEICELIMREKVNYKRIVGLIPKDVGLTRAIMAAAVEAGSLSDKDLIILAPTLEDLGLLKVQEVKERWEAALSRAEDMRAANIAARMRTKEGREKLEEAKDTALQKVVEEEMRNIRIYFIVDRSGSMDDCIARAKSHLKRFLQGFPLDRLHVSQFNTVGREVEIKHASAAGVEQAFRGIEATGGTNYGAGIRVLQHRPPKEDEDVLMIFVGDEKARSFTHDVQVSGLRPVAFGFIKVESNWGQAGRAVQDTARELGIPCIMIDEKTFGEPGADLDPYAIPRTIRNLIAATPVGVVPGRRVAPRVTLVDQIIKTPLLQKPLWAVEDAVA